MGESIKTYNIPYHNYEQELAGTCPTYGIPLEPDDIIEIVVDGYHRIQAGNGPNNRVLIEPKEYYDLNHGQYDTICWGDNSERFASIPSGTGGVNLGNEKYAKVMYMEQSGSNRRIIEGSTIDFPYEMNKPVKYTIQAISSCILQVIDMGTIILKSAYDTLAVSSHITTSWMLTILKIKYKIQNITYTALNLFGYWEEEVNQMWRNRVQDSAAMRRYFPKSQEMLQQNKPDQEEIKYVEERYIQD